MMHTFGYETSASEAALTAITPIPDTQLAITGNDVRVPQGMANIAWAAAMINSATATLRAQLASPSLRAVFPFDISPIANGLVFAGPPAINRMLRNPVPLVALESLDALVQNGAAVMNRVFATFCDGPQLPVSGNIYTVRCTAAASLVTASWVNSVLTFGSVLPAGTYQQVGMRAWSANGCAARMVYVGGIWRPGVLMQTTESAVEWDTFRFGNCGVFGQFANTTPPTVDVMGITDTAQVVLLDLIKVA